MLTKYRIVKKDGNYYPEKKEFLFFKRIYIDGIAYSSKNIEDTETIILKEIEKIRKERESEEYAKERVVKTFNKNGVFIKDFENNKHINTEEHIDIIIPKI
jgi:hypothetical protein